METFEVQQRPIYNAEKLVRSAHYRRFVKMLPCANCCRTRGIDPAHTGAHGLTQKSCDRKCIPLCRKCHDAYDADPQGKAAEWKLDVPALIAKLNTRYDQIFQKGKR